MKKGLILIVTVVILLTNCKAQLILNKPSDIVIGATNFNPNTILKNKIKSISVSIYEKPDGEIINSKGVAVIYRFNATGYLRRYTYSIATALNGNNRTLLNFSESNISTSDKVDVFVFYGIKNHIITKRIRQGDLFHSYNYEYNRQGDIRKQYHCKETNVSIDPSYFRLGKQIILAYEIFEYIKLTDFQIKKNYLNDELEVYKKGIINYDSTNNKISETAELIVSSKRNENYYTYDSLNRMVSHIHINNDYGKTINESSYKYDAKGNLISEIKTVNGILSNDIQYIYDTDNALLKSQINRDHINAILTIKKFKYRFY